MSIKFADTIALRLFKEHSELTTKELINKIDESINDSDLEDQIAWNILKKRFRLKYQIPEIYTMKEQIDFGSQEKDLREFTKQLEDEVFK